jgi:hypothetical protein
MPADPVLRLAVEAPRPEDLFEEGAFPFRGPVLKESVGDYLLTRVRTARTVPEVELDFRFDRPLSDEQKERFEHDLRAYYMVAADESQAAVRVNSVEGHRSFVLGLIGSIVAVLVGAPLVIYVGVDSYIVGFLCIVVIWVLMWDSIEMMLWDSMLLRMRSKATRKLRDATVRYAPSPPTSAGGSDR